MFKKCILSLIAGVGLIATSASAAVIVADFEEATAGSFLTADYVENGLTFSVLQNHYDVFTAGGSQVFNTDDAVQGGPNQNSIIEISFGGALFDLVSFDIVNLTNAGAFTLTSNLGDIFQIPAAIGTVNFATTFIGVTTLTLTQNSSGTLQLDNFTIDSVNGSPVPLPAALPLMIAGIAGIGAMTRRRPKMRLT